MLAAIRQLDDGPPERAARAQPRGAADGAAPSYGGCFHGGAVAHDHHQRDHAALRKVDVLDVVPCLVQGRAVLEQDGSQMGR